MADDCIFCAIAARSAPAEVVEADDDTIAFMDLNPATRGHTLVIPRHHATDLFEISPESLAATVKAAKRIAERMPERLGADGVNILNSCGRDAWQTVFHFHLHVIPRYKDDPLRLPWDPAAADGTDIGAVAELLR